MPGSSQRQRPKDSHESSFYATASSGGMTKKLQKMRRTCRSRMDGVRKAMDQKSKEIKEW